MRYLLKCLLHLALLLPVTATAQVVVETITAPFNASGGVAIDDTGLVYVADFGALLGNANGTNVFWVLDDGTVQLFATGLLGASGNDFDSQGNLFQSNIAGNRISKITPDGTVSTFATAGIIGPVGVAVGKGDTIYVANCGGGSIAKVSPSGASSIWVSSGLLQCPNGLTLDDNGNLYTCNFNNGNIVKITPDKQVSILATVPGGRCGHLTYFEGVLYVVARCAQQIYKVTLTGDTALLAGSGLRGNTDGPAESASFNHANGIRAKRVGNDVVLYVNDAVSLFGTCTTMPLNPVLVRKITIGPQAANFQAHADSSRVSVSSSVMQANGTDSAFVTVRPLNNLAMPPFGGVDSVTLSNTGGGQVTTPAVDNGDGTFRAKVVASTTPGVDTIVVSIDAGGVATELSAKPEVTYWRCGDVDGNFTGPDIADLTFMIDFLFITFTPPPILASANVDCVGNIDIADLTALIDHLFINFAPLCCI